MVSRLLIDLEDDEDMEGSLHIGSRHQSDAHILFDDELTTNISSPKEDSRLLDVDQSPLDIFLRSNRKMKTSNELVYTEVSLAGAVDGCLDSRRLLAYIKTILPRTDDNHDFDNAAPLAQRDLLRMHHAVVKSDDIVLTVRKHCILFQLDPIKALILSNHVFIFHDNLTEKPLIREVIDKLKVIWTKAQERQHRLLLQQLQEETSPSLASTDNSPIAPPSSANAVGTALELTSLDTLLRMTLEFLAVSVHDCAYEVRHIMRTMDRSFFLPAEVAEQIRRVKTRLIKHELWTQACYERLTALSEDDEEMALMLLTRANYSSIPKSTSANNINGKSDGHSNTATVDDLLQLQVENISQVLVDYDCHLSGSLMANKKSAPASSNSSFVSTAVANTSVTNGDDALHSTNRNSHNIVTSSSLPPLPHLPLLPFVPSEHNHLQDSAASAADSAIVEDLLETHILELGALAGRVKHHLGLLVNAEETIQLRLSTIENELLLANTNFLILLCGLNFGLYISGLCAMNLNSDQLASFPHGFNLVTSVTSVVIVLGVVIARVVFERGGVLPNRVTKQYTLSPQPLYLRHHPLLSVFFPPAAL